MWVVRPLLLLGDGVPLLRGRLEPLQGTFRLGALAVSALEKDVHPRPELHLLLPLSPGPPRTIAGLGPGDGGGQVRHHRLGV